MLPFAVLARRLVAAIIPTIKPPRASNPTPALNISSHSIDVIILAAITKITIAAAMPTSMLPTLNTALAVLPLAVLATRLVAAISPTIKPVIVISPTMPTNSSSQLSFAICFMILDIIYNTVPNARITRANFPTFNAPSGPSPILLIAKDIATITPANAVIIPTDIHSFLGLTNVNKITDAARIAIAIAKDFMASALTASFIDLRSPSKA